MAKNGITGKYLYNTAFKLIDYSGDVAKGNTAYSEYFSPNNVRRLIISPDVVLAEYYVSIPNIGRAKMVRIPAAMLKQVESLPDYVPIVQIISSDRICSSIEEIVFLMRSNDGQVVLGANEYDFASMIANYTSRSGDILETIKKRYVRLRDIVIIQGNYSQFRQLVRRTDDNIGDLSAVKGYAKIQKIHTEADWYTKWGSPAAAKAYPTMDGVGGHLHNYFTKDIARRRELEKKQGLEDFKKEKYAGIQKDFEEAYAKVYSIMKMCALLQKLFKQYGTTNEVDFEPFSGSPEKLYEVEGLKNYPLTVKAPDGMDKKEIYTENLGVVKRMLQNYVLDASTKFIHAMHSFYGVSPLAVRVMFNKCREVRVVVPYALNSEAEELERECHCKIEGKNSITSYAFCCWLSVLFLLNRSGDGLNPAYLELEYWRK